MPKRRVVKRRTRRPYSSLTAREKSMYDRTTNLISDLRRGKGPYKKLLRKHHLSSARARENAGRDLIGGTKGKPVRASKSDKRVRDVWFPKSFGDVPFRSRNSRDATTLSEFLNDRYKLLRDKLSAVDFECKWRGVHVAGEELFSDVIAILGMADDGVLNIENLYTSTTEDR